MKNKMRTNRELRDQVQEEIEVAREIADDMLDYLDYLDDLRDLELCDYERSQQKDPYK